MRSPEHTPPDRAALAWADERLEAYLDGALDAADAARVERLLDDAPSLRREFAAAQRVQDELRLMPQPMCPPHLAVGILDEIERRERASFAGRLARVLARVREAVRMAGRSTWRPALAGIGLLLVVATAALLGRPAAPPPADTAEVRQAMDEVKWALAFLSNVGREAGQVVREDVLESHVVRPVQSALGEFLETPSSSSAPNESDALR